MMETELKGRWIANHFLSEFTLKNINAILENSVYESCNCWSI